MVTTWNQISCPSSKLWNQQEPAPHPYPTPLPLPTKQAMSLILQPHDLQINCQQGNKHHMWASGRRNKERIKGLLGGGEGEGVRDWWEDKDQPEGRWCNGGSRPKPKDWWWEWTGRRAWWRSKGCTLGKPGGGRSACWSCHDECCDIAASILVRSLSSSGVIWDQGHTTPSALLHLGKDRWCQGWDADLPQSVEVL